MGLLLAALRRALEERLDEVHVPMMAGIAATKLRLILLLHTRVTIGGIEMIGHVALALGTLAIGCIIHVAKVERECVGTVTRVIHIG